MANNRPHILLITCDELRADALGCYGGRAVATPNLDALAGVATLFDSAYSVSPLCLPSRCAMITGRYPHRSGAYSNFRPCPLRPETPNLYNQMRAAGYRTGHIGKCHYLPVPYHLPRPDATIDSPDGHQAFYASLGIDHLQLQDGTYGSLWFWDDYSRELESAGLLETYRRAAWDKSNHMVFDLPIPADWHPDAWTGRKAEEYLERCDPEQPQFLWASFSGPHYPFDPPAEYLQCVDSERSGGAIVYRGEWDDPTKIQYAAWHGGGKGQPVAEGAHHGPGGACKNFPDEYWRRLRRGYFATVSLLDERIGRVLAAARRRLGDNVLVLFTADHGELAGEHGLWGKNSCAYESVLRVPLLTQFPGGQNPPRRTDAPAMLIDLLPTILNTAGVAPSNPIDGVDLRIRLAEPHPRLLRFAECERFAVVSDGRWKYAQLTSPAHPTCELYDLATDPHELRSLANNPAYLGELARLRGALVEHFMGGVLA